MVDSLLLLMPALLPTGGTRLRERLDHRVEAFPREEMRRNRRSSGAILGRQVAEDPPHDLPLLLVARVLRDDGEVRSLLTRHLSSHRGADDGPADSVAEHDSGGGSP